jgi:hypothetical protein
MVTVACGVQPTDSPDTQATVDGSVRATVVQATIEASAQATLRVPTPTESRLPPTPTPVPTPTPKAFPTLSDSLRERMTSTPTPPSYSPPVGAPGILGRSGLPSGGLDLPTFDVGVPTPNPTLTPTPSLAEMQRTASIGGRQYSMPGGFVVVGRSNWVAVSVERTGALPTIPESLAPMFSHSRLTTNESIAVSNVQIWPRLLPSERAIMLDIVEWYGMPPADYEALVAATSPGGGGSITRGTLGR